jgi:uncharacterized membrane protein YgaE (UPF0421/DUF939 family)
MLSWGIRMTIAVVVPLFYGTITGQGNAAMWMIISAESISWVELKGSFAQRTRVLTGGAFLALLFGFAGCISSGSLWLSMLLMMIVVFIACLFKNLGERGSGLSLSVYVMFIVANAYPVKDLDDTLARCLFIFIGGLWSIVVGVVASLFISEQTPYKRSIAFIWKSTASLAAIIDKGWDAQESRAGIRAIYLKEKEVRTAIESSLQLYDKLAHQNNHDNSNALHMAQLRKTASLVAANIMAIAEELESINLKSLPRAQKLSVHAILKSIEVICERLTIYTVSSKTEEEVLLQSRIIRLQNMCALLEESKEEIEIGQRSAVLRLIHFTERIIKLIETSMAHIASTSTDKKVYRSYSPMKTLLILHHKHWFRSIRRLANINTHSFRYALRTAIVGTLGLFIAKWQNIHYGYWLPFTVMIVIQPYFGATLRKALDRVWGTVLGVIIGGLLLMLPAQLHIQDVLIIICPIFMVYFLRTRYSTATFFITVFLVSLFAIEDGLSTDVILIRTLCTIGGAALAVIAEFALLPNWDKKWLPRHLATAIKANYDYFVFSFYPQANSPHSWTYYRRIAESSNSNAFDSFNRYLEEPTTKGKTFSSYYQMISHCIRITRELNNGNIEEEITEQNISPDTIAQQQQKMKVCLEMFNKIMTEIINLGFEAEHKLNIRFADETNILNHPLNEMQSIYLDKISIELNAFCRDLEKLSDKS